MGDPKDFQLRNTLYQPPGKELHYDGLHDAEVPMGPLESLAARSKQGSTSPVQRVGLGGTRAADAGGYAAQAKPRAMTPEELMQAANEMMDHTHAQHVMGPALEQDPNDPNVSKRPKWLDDYMMDENQ